MLSVFCGQRTYYAIFAWHTEIQCIVPILMQFLTRGLPCTDLQCLADDSRVYLYDGRMVQIFRDAVESDRTLQEAALLAEGDD
jgi:hypothetical protein